MTAMATLLIKWSAICII